MMAKAIPGVLRFTLSFDAQHHASVKNVGKTKTEVEEKANLVQPKRKGLNEKERNRFSFARFGNNGARADPLE